MNDMNDMNGLNPAQLQRVRELLIDERLDQLSFEERAELDALLEHPGAARVDSPDVVGDLLVKMYTNKNAQHPPGLREKVLAQGEKIIGGKSAAAGGGAVKLTMPTSQRPVVVPAESSTRSKLPWLLAATLALAGGLGYLAWSGANAAKQARQAAETSRAEIVRVRGENETLLAAAEKKAQGLAKSVADAQSRATELDKKLADAAAREVKLAQDLSAATKNLDAVNLRIAKYETPEDPKQLAARRTKLLESPGREGAQSPSRIAREKPHVVPRKLDIQG